MLDNIKLLRTIYLLMSAIKWKLLGLNVSGFPLIYKNVRIRGPKRIYLSRNAKLFPYSYLKSCDGVIKIGDNSSVGEFTYINASESVTIGNNCLIAPSCHITDSNHGIELGIPIKDQAKLTTAVEIEDDVWIGAGAKILAGVKIRRGAVIGAGAVVTKNVEANMIVAGIPAKPIGIRKPLSN